MSHTSRRLGMAGTVLTAVAIAASPAGAGPAMAGTEYFDRVGFEELTGYLDKGNVRHASMYGIGQMPPVNPPCTCYLNAPALPWCRA